MRGRGPRYEGRFAGPTRPPAPRRGFLGKRRPVRPFFRGSAARKGIRGALRAHICRNTRRFSLICGLTSHRYGATASIPCQTSHFLASGAPFFQSTPRGRRSRDRSQPKRRRQEEIGRRSSLNAGKARGVRAFPMRAVCTPQERGKPWQLCSVEPLRRLEGRRNSFTSSASRFRWRRRRDLPEACPRPGEPGCTAGWHSLPPCRHRPPPARP